MSKLTTILMMFIMIISNLGTAQSQTATIQGDFVQAKKSFNNGVIVGVQPSLNENAKVFILDSNLLIKDSILVPNDNHLGSSTPVPGSSSYLGSKLTLVTSNNNIGFSAVTKLVVGVNSTRTIFYKNEATDSIHRLASFQGGYMRHLTDYNGVFYVSYDVSMNNGTKAGTGIYGSGGSNKFSGTGYGSYVVAMDTTSSILSNSIGRTYMEMPLGYVARSTKLLLNGNLLITTTDGVGSACICNPTHTRFIEIDLANPTMTASDLVRIVRDTIINGPADILELPNSNWAIISNNGATSSHAALNILDSNWNLIKEGYQYAGTFGFDRVGKNILNLFDGFIFSSAGSLLFSQNANIIEINAFLRYDGTSDMYTIFGNNTIRYGYNVYSADSVMFGKASFVPDTTLVLKVKDTDPAVTGAYNYVKRYLSTDSLVSTDEPQAYLKFANASTYTSVGVGNPFPMSVVSAWCDFDTNQYANRWYLYYDSLQAEYYTYFTTVKNIGTFTYSYSASDRQKWLKVILTTDPVDTGGVVIPPPPNNLPWHTIGFQTWHDTLTLNKSFNAGGATDADGDTLRYFATGLPPGKSIDSITGTIIGTPLVVGSFPIQVWVTDGKDTVPKSHIINVAIRHYASLQKNEVKAVKLFPNPVENVIHIATPETIQSYQLFASTGKLILEKNKLATHQCKVDVSLLNPGIYVMIIYFQNGERQLHQVIKQ